MPHFKDLAGRRYGRLTVTGLAGLKPSRWYCKCDCGSQLIVQAQNLSSGNTKSCGCYKREQTSATHSYDLTGQRFNRLVVQERVGSKWGQALWLCTCDCGETARVPGKHLRKGNTKSCGCYRRERVAKVSSVDLTGRRFGKLTVLERAARDDKGKTQWLCICDCGAEKIVRTTYLGAGDTKTCGSCGSLPKGAAGFNRLVRVYKRAANKRGYVWQLQEADVYKITRDPCVYCGVSPAQASYNACAVISVQQYGTYRYNGIDRIDNNTGYVLGNVVPCCGDCNTAKMKRSLEEWVVHVLRSGTHLTGSRVTQKKIDAAVARVQAVASSYM